MQQSPLVPMVRFFLPDGTAGNAIADTGSESTLFDMQFVKAHKNHFEIKKTKEKITLVGVDSKTAHPILNIKSELSFGDDIVYPTEGMVSDLSYVKNHTKQNFDMEIDAIFGSDFLKNIKAEINFPEQALYIGNDISGKQ